MIWPDFSCVVEAYSFGAQLCVVVFVNGVTKLSLDAAPLLVPDKLTYLLRLSDQRQVLCTTLSMFSPLSLSLRRSYVFPFTLSVIKSSIFWCGLPFGLLLDILFFIISLSNESGTKNLSYPRCLSFSAYQCPVILSPRGQVGLGLGLGLENLSSLNITVHVSFHLHV